MSCAWLVSDRSWNPSAGRSYADYQSRVVRTSAILAALLGRAAPGPPSPPAPPPPCAKPDRAFQRLHTHAKSVVCARRCVARSHGLTRISSCGVFRLGQAPEATALRLRRTFGGMQGQGGGLWHSDRVQRRDHSRRLRVDVCQAGDSATSLTSGPLLLDRKRF